MSIIDLIALTQASLLESVFDFYYDNPARQPGGWHRAIRAHIKA
jgi:hypothetical protein